MSVRDNDSKPSRLEEHNWGVSKETNLRHLAQERMRNETCGSSRIYNAFTEDVSGIGEVCVVAWVRRSSASKVSSAGSCVTRVCLASLAIARYVVTVAGTS